MFAQAVGAGWQDRSSWETPVAVSEQYRTGWCLPGSNNVPFVPHREPAVQPRLRGRGLETPAQAAERARFDLALVAVLSDGGLRRSEAAALIWGDVQRWDDGSGRITVIR